jgi:hypothetical protein
MAIPGGGDLRYAYSQYQRMLQAAELHVTSHLVQGIVALDIYSRRGIYLEWATG